ncbi:MAG: tyrosine-type recombinase/integrase [Cyanobacteriota bacterium]
MATVGIEKKNGRLRLRLPRSVADGSSRYISTGLTPEDFRKAQAIAWQIEDDIKTGNLDTSLKRYKSAFQQKQKIVKRSPEDLVSLWSKYSDYMRPQVAETTYEKEYKRKYKSKIGQLPTKDITQVATIKDWLLSQHSVDTTKRVLTQISACCNWAKSSGLIESNPFLGTASTIKQSKASKQIDPFSIAERQAILEAFQENKNHYHSFVSFLFATGCRTGEAIALTWRHISQDLAYVIFSESYDSQLGIRKGTKTGKTRRFPVNRPLRLLLETIRPERPSQDALVFPSPTGIYINNAKFTNQVWRGCTVGGKTYRGIVTDLVNQGLVERYRPPYNTRHTFITLALANGLTVSQVASLVGNSPEVILRHYAGSQVLEVPEF